MPVEEVVELRFYDLESIVGKKPFEEIHGPRDVAGGAVDVGVHQPGPVVWPPVARVQARSVAVPIETAPVEDEPMPGQLDTGRLFEFAHPVQLPLLRCSGRPPSHKQRWRWGVAPLLGGKVVLDHVEQGPDALGGVGRSCEERAEPLPPSCSSRSAGCPTRWPTCPTSCSKPG